MNIKGNKITLRFIEPDDLEAIREMSNDSEQEYMIGGWSLPAAKKHQEEWYQRILGDKNNIRFAIDYSGSFVGLVTLTDIDWKNRRAKSGIRLTLNAPKRQGIATDALITMLDYAFEELNLHRIYATIIEHNQASRKLHAKCGYREEGLLRQSVYKRGRYHNELQLSILKSEFKEIKNNNV